MGLKEKKMAEDGLTQAGLWLANFGSKIAAPPGRFRSE